MVPSALSTRSSRRPAHPPQRYHDVIFEDASVYDRCLGGYVWPALHRDHETRQPKRDGKELDAESRLVRSIRNSSGQPLTDEGYIRDEFLESDNDTSDNDSEDEYSEDEAEYSEDDDEAEYSEDDDEAEYSEDDDDSEDETEYSEDDNDSEYEAEYSEDDNDSDFNADPVPARGGTDVAAVQQ